MNASIIYHQFEGKKLLDAFAGKVRILLAFMVLMFAFTLSLKAQYGGYSYQYYKGNVNREGGVFSNALKTDLVSIVEGDFPIIYEHRFSELFSLEVAPGVLMPYTTNFTTLWIGAKSNKDFVNDKWGYSFMVSPRFHFVYNPSHYLSTMFRYRRYSHLGVAEIGLGKGWTWNIHGRYPLEVVLYATMSWEKAYEDEKPSTFRTKEGALEDSGHKALLGLTLSIKFGMGM